VENLTLSVSEFVDFANQTLEGAYPTVTVEGEVEAFKVSQGRYVFFNLKDETASVGCFLSFYNLRVPLEDGMKVVVRARPQLTNWGKFSLTVIAMRLTGEGALKKGFELLKQKLAAEGLFDIARKRPLPEHMERIALISSTDAAGYADFIKIIGERWGGLDVEVAHTQVQGIEAPDQIIRAVRFFNQQPELADVLVIVRGGGSKQDLSAFNDELLVREIAASRIPVVTGIGHEVDKTLADLAADVRASTPSNAAQMVTPDKVAIVTRLKSDLKRLESLVIDETLRVNADISSNVERLGAFISSKVDLAWAEVQNMQKLAAQLNPENVLKQGYALVAGDIEIGSVVNITTVDKIAKAEVKYVKKR
jgi:exodeoxyribonuclease VII large subunit